jgi:hypothetical protein
MLKAKAAMEIAWLQASTRRQSNGGFLTHSPPPGRAAPAA